MRYHGLYFIPNTSAQLAASLDFVKAIVGAIETNFPRADQTGAWTLNHRILRDVPPYSENAQADYKHAYQHLLHVSTVSPDRTYNLIQHPPQATQNGTPQVAIAAIPSNQTDAHFGFLANQMPLLWSPLRLLDVANGKTYQAGDFLLHIGELRSKRNAQTGTQSSPGVVVCISTYAGGSEDEEDSSSTEDPIDFEYAQEAIRELWSTIRKDLVFGRSDPREHMQLPRDVGRDEEQAREAVVRMWCEALSPQA